MSTNGATLKSTLLLALKCWRPKLKHSPHLMAWPNKCLVKNMCSISYGPGYPLKIVIRLCRRELLLMGPFVPFKKSGVIALTWIISRYNHCLILCIFNYINNINNFFLFNLIFNILICTFFLKFDFN